MEKQQSSYPPLPPGWEAKWDANKRAFQEAHYIDHCKQLRLTDSNLKALHIISTCSKCMMGKCYYIDHNTKTTTWENPSWSNKQKQAAIAHPAGKVPSQSEGIALRDMSHASPKRSPLPGHPPHQSPARQETAFTDHKAVQQDATVARLKARFPNAGPVIRDILTMCGNDEDATAQQLVDLGFDSADAPSGQSSRHSSVHAKGGPSTSTSPSHGASAAQTQRRQSATKSPHRVAKESPSRLQIPDAEKHQRKTRLCREFPDLSSEVVQMALEACNYDEEKSRATLGRVNTKSHKKSTSSSKDSHQSSATSGKTTSPRTLSPAPPPQQASVEPAVFGLTVEERSATSQQPSASDRRTTTSGSGVRGAQSQVSGQAGHQQRQHHHARQVTKMSEQLLSTTNDLLNHLASSAAPCCSDNQHSPKHPTDNSLSHSPSLDSKETGASQSLQTDKVVTVQPQPQITSVDQQSVPSPQRTKLAGGSSGLARGPDPAMRAGPNGLLCNGPDPSLLTSRSVVASGPDPKNYHGHILNLASGSSGAQGHNPALRCATEHSSPVAVGHHSYLQPSV